MKDVTKDSRLLLLMLAADGVEATGRAVAALWERSKRSTRAAQQLRNMEQAGLIECRGAGPLDSRLIRIAPLGRRVVLGDVDPEARWARKWDGKWRLVMFDVPQSEAARRVRLRRILRELRFGWLQNSVWISPDPLDPLVAVLGRTTVTTESLVMIEGRPAGGETDAELVAGAWKFDRLTELYESYLKLLRLRPSSGRAAKSAEWAQWSATEQRAWQEILRHDPFLPEALLPSGYRGFAVWRARQECLNASGRALADANL